MSLFGRAIQCRQFDSWIDAFFRRRVSILYYHGVWGHGDPCGRIFGGLTLDEFAADMALIANRFRPVPLSRAVEGVESYGHGDERPTVCVTFDDGCDLRRSGAIDVMRHHNVPAATFVVLSCVEGHHLMWQHAFSAIRAAHGDDAFVTQFNGLMDRVGTGSRVANAREALLAAMLWPRVQKEHYVADLWRSCGMPPVDEFLDRTNPYSTWEDLREWQSQGHEVGLHTRTHPVCSALRKWSDIEEEIVEPARVLRSALGLKAVPFAYPFGKRLDHPYEERVADAAGLSCMLGTGDISVTGTSSIALSRASGEEDLSVSLFSRPLLRSLERGIKAALYQ